MKKDENAYFRDAFLGICHITLKLLHPYHTAQARNPRIPRHASSTESNFRLRKRPRVGKREAVSAGGQAASACGESVGASVRASYDPLDPLELEPWSGGAELGVDAAGLELGGDAGTGDAGFGAIWLAGAAGAAGRGAIGDAPACVGEGDTGPVAGGVAETGRAGAGGGAKGLGAGGGDATAGFGGDGGATGRGAGAGMAAIGFGGGGAAGFGAGIAAAGCLGGAVF
jgi:hypothetical protein